MSCKSDCPKPCCGSTKCLDKYLSQIQKKINKLITCCLPGLAVGIIHQGQTVLSQGYGIRNTNLDPVDSDTVFPLTHASQTFVAAYFGHLATTNRICFNQMTDSFCGLPTSRCRSDLTVRDVLTQQTGTINPMTYYIQLLLNHTPVEMVQLLECEKYNNFANCAVANLTYPDQLQRCACAYTECVSCNFWDSVGLTYTQGQMEYDIQSNKAEPMWKDCNGGWPSPYTIPLETLPYAYGAGTNLTSMLKFVEMFLTDGVINQQPVLSQEAIRQLLLPQIPICDSECDVLRFCGSPVLRTMGWFNICYSGYEIYVSSGYSEAGTRVYILLIPKCQFAFVGLSNSYNSHVPALAFYAAMLLLKNDKRLADKTYKAMLKWDTDFMRKIVCGDPKCCPPKDCRKKKNNAPNYPIGTWYNKQYGKIIIEPLLEGDSYNVLITLGNLTPVIAIHMQDDVWSFTVLDANNMERKGYFTPIRNSCFQVERLNVQIFCLSLYYKPYTVLESHCLPVCPEKDPCERKKHCYDSCTGVQRSNKKNRCGCCDDSCSDDCTSSSEDECCSSSSEDDCCQDNCKKKTCDKNKKKKRDYKIKLPKSYNKDSNNSYVTNGNSISINGGSSNGNSISMNGGSSNCYVANGNSISINGGSSNGSSNCYVSNGGSNCYVSNGNSTSNGNSISITGGSSNGSSSNNNCAVDRYVKVESDNLPLLSYNPVRQNILLDNIVNNNVNNKVRNNNSIVVTPQVNRSVNLSRVRNPQSFPNSRIRAMTTRTTMGGGCPCNKK